MSKQRTSLARLCTFVLLFVLVTAADAATLMHHYDFNSGVTDVVGSANGTFIGGAGVSGGRLVLDGVNDYVQFDQAIVPTSGSYSVALFGLRATKEPWYTEMISQGWSGGPGFYIGSNLEDDIRVSDSWMNTGVPFGAVGKMTHYALTVDEATGVSTLYKNGWMVASVPFAITVGAGGDATRLGRQFSIECCAESFNGELADLRIYNGALTAKEVAEIAGVPEPQTYAQMIGGLLLLVGLGRTRKP